MAYLASDDDTAQELDNYDKLARERPILGAVLAVGIGSLAGIPPLAGFMGKLLIFVSAYQAGLYWLLAVAIIGVVLSIYYYFGWIKAAFFETWTPNAGATPARPAPPATPFVGRFVLVMLALATVMLGLYQAPLASWLVP
jgi:NADH-quinone oxidoreductase subunit N